MCVCGFSLVIMRANGPGDGMFLKKERRTDYFRAGRDAEGAIRSGKMLMPTKRS